MEAWGWILVYLVGFTLFQLLLFRYFSDDGSFGARSLGTNEASAPGPVDRGEGSPDSNALTGTDPASETGPDVDGVRCRQCGTVNADESQFAYCRECLAQLR